MSVDFAYFRANIATTFASYAIGAYWFEADETGYKWHVYNVEGSRITVDGSYAQLLAFFGP